MFLPEILSDEAEWNRYSQKQGNRLTRRGENFMGRGDQYKKRALDRRQGLMSNQFVHTMSGFSLEE